MRAIAAFILVVLAIPPLFALLALERSMADSHSRSMQAVLSMEARRSFELEAKGALRSALSQLPAGLSRAEAAAAGGERAAAWAAWLESRASSLGYKVRAWCGSANWPELEGMQALMLKTGDARSCSSCLNPSLIAIDSEGRPVRACSALLDMGAGGLEVSRAGLNRVPSLSAWSLPSDFVGFGASVYSPSGGWASVFLMPEGFRRLIG